MSCSLCYCYLRGRTCAVVRDIFISWEEHVLQLVLLLSQGRICGLVCATVISGEEHVL